jgi:hypothetical protein
LSLLPIILTSAISGLYTSLWGAFKDSPYEGFKKGTFPRSIVLSLCILGVIYSIPQVRVTFLDKHLFQIFFMVMGIERFLTEIYKGFFRTEDQTKYFIPSRITLLGKPINSDALRYVVGTLIIGLMFGLLFLDITIDSFWQFVGVAFVSGSIVSLGGAYKDAPFEGFDIRKFFRSAWVLTLVSPLFYQFGPVSLGFLIYMNGGLERFLVEYYKTYIQRNMSGKFRPDTKRIEIFVNSREKFHVGAWIIIISLAGLFIYEQLNI